MKRAIETENHGLWKERPIETAYSILMADVKKGSVPQLEVALFGPQARGNVHVCRESCLYECAQPSPYDFAEKQNNYRRQSSRTFGNNRPCSGRQLKPTLIFHLTGVLF